MTFPSCYNELQRHFSYDGVLGKHMYYGSHVPSNFLYTDSMQTNNENRDRIKGTKNSSSCSTHVLLEKVVNEPFFMPEVSKSGRCSVSQIKGGNCQKNVSL